MKKNFNVFSIIFLLASLQFNVYAMKPSDCKGKGKASDEQIAVLPDISPKQFGITSGEPYIRALHDFAQALLMQHRWLKVFLIAADTSETLNKHEQLEDNLNQNAWNRMVLLDQSPDACFVSNSDADPDFFKRLQEIRLALTKKQDHELIVGAPGEIRIYAATLKGIELLLKHRSLFMQNSIDIKHELLIDRIYQEATHQENMEVLLLAMLLKLKLEKSQLNASQIEFCKKHDVCREDAINSTGWVKKWYKLSDELQSILGSTARLQDDFEHLLYFSKNAMVQPQPESRIPGNPTKFKRQTIAKYNQTQPAIYAAVRKKLQEQTLHMAKKDRRFLAYAKTVKGEHLPEQLDSLEDSESQVIEPVQSPNSAKAAAKTQKAPKVKQKASKAQKKKRPETKSTKHKALSHSVTPHDDSQDVQEQTDSSAPSTSSAVPVKVAVVQEEQAEVNVSTSVCAVQGGAPSATPAEHPAEVSPVTSTSTKHKYKIVKPVATYAASSNASHHEVPNLIDIPYIDGQVRHTEEGSTVEIDDPCNKMRIYLYQTDSTATERTDFEPRYRSNVSIWFKFAKVALSKLEYYAATPDKQDEKVRIHRFSKLVDRFIPTMGVSRSVPSRIAGHTNETEIAIPGYVEFCESGAKRSCLFVYIIDSSDGKCFHRNIEFRESHMKTFAELCKKGCIVLDPRDVN